MQSSVEGQKMCRPNFMDAKLIYVVDDESMIGDVVQVILRLNGYTPKVFSDPEHAWRSFLAEESKPALLLTDYLMSPIDGIKLIERCKALCPALRTILYSGNAGEEVLLQAKVRPDAFLRKPFLPRTLLALIRSTLP
jgi:DNA-binding NtrC family response regulator